MIRPTPYWAVARHETLDGYRFWIRWYGKNGIEENHELYIPGDLQKMKRAEVIGLIKALRGRLD